jgi:hypothetical protein
MIKRKRRIYLCYDYKNNERLKNIIFGYLNSETSLLKITDYSRMEKLDQKEWEENIKSRFANIDAIVIILGEQTYRAINVIEEIDIAYKMELPIVQFSITRHGVNRGLPNGGPIVKWDWEILQKKILIRVPY